MFPAFSAEPKVVTAETTLIGLVGSEPETAKIAAAPSMIVKTLLAVAGVDVQYRLKLAWEVATLVPPINVQPVGVGGALVKPVGMYANRMSPVA